MEDLLGRGEPPELAVRQLKEEDGRSIRKEVARYRRMEDLLGRGGQVPEDGRPIRKRWPGTGGWKTYLSVRYRRMEDLLGRGGQVPEDGGPIRKSGQVPEDGRPIRKR